jgi:CHAD domain-containing protein
MRQTETLRNIKKAYRKRADLIGNILADYGNDHDVETIHRLRVAMKKNRAVIALLSSLFPERSDEIKRWKIFKKVFRCAGEMRETQLLLTRVKELPLDRKIRAQLRHELESELKRQKGKFDHAVDQFDEKGDRKLLRKIHLLKWERKKETPKHALEKYSNGFLEKIRKMVSGKLGEEELHEARKHLKVLLAIIPFMDCENGKESSRAVYSKIEHAAEVLGQWHDGQVMKLFLRRFMRKNKIRDRQFDNILSNLDRADKAMRKKIRPALGKTGR